MIVRFVDIGGIVDHHRLNYLFIIFFCLTNLLDFALKLDIHNVYPCVFLKRNIDDFFLFRLLNCKMDSISKNLAYFPLSFPFAVKRDR